MAKRELIEFLNWSRIISDRWRNTDKLCTENWYQHDKTIGTKVTYKFVDELNKIITKIQCVFQLSLKAAECDFLIWCLNHLLTIYIMAFHTGIFPLIHVLSQRGPSKENIFSFSCMIFKRNTKPILQGVPKKTEPCIKYATYQISVNIAG